MLWDGECRGSWCFNPVPQPHGQSRKETAISSKVNEKTCTRDATANCREKANPSNTCICCPRSCENDIFHLVIVSKLPGRVQLPKPKRCMICLFSRDRKTNNFSASATNLCAGSRHTCTLMQTCLLDTCALMQTSLLEDCHPPGKTSCKLLFFAWHLCTFIYAIAKNRV